MHAGLDSLSGVPLAQAFADVELLLQELQQIMSLDTAANDPRKVCLPTTNESACYI